MADCEINRNHLLYYLLIVVIIFIVDVYCGDTTNVWERNRNIQQASSTVGTLQTWGVSSTTPWPELTVKRQYNQNNNNRNEQTKRISLDLANSGQHRSSQKSDSQKFNSAGNVALSYGPGELQNLNQIANQAKKTQSAPNQPQKPNGVINQSTLGPSTPADSSLPSGNTNPNKEDEEFREFSEQLIRKDSSNVASYVKVNYQGKTTSRSPKDEAPLPLLDVEEAAYRTTTISKLLALHNNYVMETNVNEYVTPQERTEENEFLDAVVGTSVMQHARNFLIRKGALSRDPKDFRDKLKEIWFNMYSRGGGRIGSSGFEHVFLAEVKPNNEVSGLHNWVYFKDSEDKGRANYLGYMKKFDFGNKGGIIKYHFTLNQLDKPVGSMFVGTSPELEFALYSTCFLLRADKVCPLRYEGKNFIVRTFTFRYRGKNMIGSAFPEI